ncbi:MAG: thiamine pyrophosphate-binding protein [Gammaproteobacteria bacterium]|nr:thiamine pyrophosphate-binding protein [Gammaproteobacteria bacterium]NIR84405.1 thiamine pyrophosphate-binding protein [Gammaproteobacteria bacterium]NIR90886.1 thiamine pyrophosphate-binding protein [Gammaproteobacteria bacterium]NIU07072.1 thiamine pyrophosphate-binding protein [Gammaproteobacteria bacterium]NIV76201.1 thiamine pyrophosphate-binding protein [Gammaproteobacteria bacterium]
MSSNRLSGAEAVVRMLEAQGVTHVFGLCGDTSLPLYDALYRLGGGITHVLTRDERSAAYMADVYARVSGRVGVCEGPSGGGATYMVPGVAEANESSSPVLAITTDIATGARGRSALTEIDQESLFRPACKWNRLLSRASQIPVALRTAFSQMTTGRPGAAHIGLPFDVQNDAVEEDAVWTDPALERCPSRRMGPDPEMVAAAAQALRGAERPVLVCGGGVVISGAEEQLRAVAEGLGAPVATSVSGQGAISDTHPLSLGVVGSNGGTPATRAVLETADLIVFVGCRTGSVTTERWRVPAPRRVRVVHVDIDPAIIGISYPTDVAVVGDARLCLAALNDALGAQGTSGDGPDTVRRAREEKFAAFRELAQADAVPIRPERIIAELQRVLPRDAVVIADPGTPCPYVSAYYEFEETGRHFVSNRAHGALGYGLPGVVGAYYARPAAKSVAIMGDGGFGFAAGELETIVRLDLPVTLIVLTNSNYGWIKAGQKSGYGARYYSVDFSTTHHAAVAQAYGLKAWHAREPGALRAALTAAIEAGGPALVDIATQPLHEARAPVSEWIA